MISLDTNFLVRYLERDDPQQFKVVDSIIDECIARREDILITHVVLCETVWVLSTRYDCTRTELVSLLENLLHASQFVFEDKALLRRAWEDYRDGKGDFSDYLIGQIAKHSGVSTTYTFDKALKHSPLFTVL